MLHHPVLRLLDLCDRVVVVIGADVEEPPMPAGAPVTFARDSAVDEGPLRGLAAGLGIADAAWAVVAGGDMPDLQPPVLREMLRAARETAAVAVVLSDGGDARPLPCVVRTEPAADAAAVLLGSGRRRLRDLLAAVRTVVVDEPSWAALDPERRTLVDIDEPADVERAPRREARAVPHEPFKLGSLEVVPLCDGWAPLPLDDEAPGHDVDWDEQRARFPWAFPPDDPTSWAWHVHAFLIRHPDGPVLVDTGIGGLGRPPFDVAGRLEDELASIGVSPDSVRHVILTHLHGDHSGGACAADGSPLFPNARYHVHPEDWTFFANHRTPEDLTGRFAMAGLEGLGMLDLDPSDHEVVAGLSVRHAPGHTPGHRVIQLEDGTRTLLLVGDLLHTTPQVSHPTWRSNHDEDPELAAEHRALWIDAADREGWTVCVGHFGLPFGRVAAAGWSPV